MQSRGGKRGTEERGNGDRAGRKARETEREREKTRSTLTIGEANRCSLHTTCIQSRATKSVFSRGPHREQRKKGKRENDGLKVSPRGTGRARIGDVYMVIDEKRLKKKCETRGKGRMIGWRGVAGARSASRRRGTLFALRTSALRGWRASHAFRGSIRTRSSSHRSRLPRVRERRASRRRAIAGHTRRPLSRSRARSTVDAVFPSSEPATKSGRRHHRCPGFPRRPTETRLGSLSRTSARLWDDYT